MTPVIIFQDTTNPAHVLPQYSFTELLPLLKNCTTLHPPIQRKINMVVIIANKQFNMTSSK